ncbi:MAG: N-acetylmuramic acid 6-phosphate etherase [Candidatus Tokpelaia hoelldobleri]|uniref:N-acetylmuramic acid 6-phosphate etherase n=1 Tax=Candidatus Tokpelaia hoelldobleri TaxID=1902579 RepID=A0A1U9JVE2_9HYPH|nr:MAG: N-acetylmuramic acid 6-phosphate etherase [Candidatus Tokpelaia hoelldoblerii]
MHFKMMMTESRNRKTMDLDIWSALQIVTAMNAEDAGLAKAVQPALGAIAQVAEWAAAAFGQGGRLIYMGAGTSGRLGVLDASECPPTFGVPPEQIVGLIAGGDVALRSAAEGAEDDENLGRYDLQACNLKAVDVVVGIAASGRTPYVLGGLAYATELGCHTAAISCNAASPAGRIVQCAIEVIAGAEVLTGSTRLKAGTVQKMVLNMISTASMVLSGKAYQNLMVDVVQSNEKLHRRAETIVVEATGVAQEEARVAIEAAGGQVKVAIVMLLAQCGRGRAESLLVQANGHVRTALQRE